jgi:opacity protein-like surface antigen
MRQPTIQLNFGRSYIMPRTAPVLLLLTAGLAAISMSTVATAQEGPVVHWHVMGGYSETVGSTNKYLQGGYLVSGGFSVTPSRTGPVDFRFDLSYSEHQATNYLLDLGQRAANTQVDYGTGSFWSGTGNVLYHVPLAYGVRAYGIAGIGVYHERVELAQYDPYGGYFYCDPFSDYCQGGNLGLLVSSSGVTKFGWNAGIGVEFALPYGRAWFLEARYHRIDTAAPIEYVPITIGYRF